MGATLARRAGEAEELAVLLCSLLLGSLLEGFRNSRRELCSQLRA